MAGHMESPRGPHAARGPRVGQHGSRQKEVLTLNASADNLIQSTENIK